MHESSCIHTFFDAFTLTDMVHEIKYDKTPTEQPLFLDDDVSRAGTADCSARTWAFTAATLNDNVAKVLSDDSTIVLSPVKPYHPYEGDYTF